MRIRLFLFLFLFLHQFILTILSFFFFLTQSCRLFFLLQPLSFKLFFDLLLPFSFFYASFFFNLEEEVVLESLAVADPPLLLQWIYALEIVLGLAIHQDAAAVFLLSFAEAHRDWNHTPERFR